MGRPGSLTSLLLTVALIAGCGGSGSSGGNGLEKTTITVAALPLVDDAALYIATKRKLFENEGLRVQVKPVAQSIQALPALQNGQVDVIAGANYVTFLQASEKGLLKLRIVAGGAANASRFTEVLVMPNSPVKQAKDLEGRTLAVNILNNIQSLTTNQVLKANSVDPSKVEYRAVPFPQMGAALQKGQIDAVNTAEPFGTDLKRKLGARMVLDVGGAPVTDLPISGYVSTQQFVSKNPKTAAAFQRAIQKAQQLASADRKQVEAVLPSYARIDAQTASRLNLPHYPASLDPASLQRLADLMLQDRLLKNKVDMKSVIFTPATK